MSTCDAMMLDRTIQGRASSPVVDTTAAAVSSQDVSIPRTFMGDPRSRLSLRVEQRLQAVAVRRPRDTTFSDDARHQLGRRDIEGRIPDAGTFRRETGAAQMRDLFRRTL